MVEAAPSPSFKMSQPDLLLEFLIVAFDAPSQLGNVDELTERDVFRNRRQPIFDRLFLAIGPFNQQPLLRPTVGEPVIPMRDTNAHTGKMRDFNVTPHVAQNTTNRLSAIDHRTTRHCGYEISQQKRKRVEEPFGWGKTIGGLARPMLRGVKKLDFEFTLTMAAYDLIKLPRLIGAAA